MGHWLATERTVQDEGVVTRFDPRFWTVNFPRPMMASVVSTAPDGLRVDAMFYRTDDLAGLIWASEDVIDHPLLRYETARDYRGCTLRFRWQSAGVMPLNAVNGPTLTIEGRDATGNPRAWFVRLWNYASGSPEDALIAIDFDALDAGFLLPDEGDPVWAGDVDRLFISIVPHGYSGLGANLPGPAEVQLTLSDIVCDGPGSVLAIGDVMVPEHGIGIASGYDDSYNVTPARLLRAALQLGYRGDIIHYVGMSHYLRLEANSGGFYASLAGGAINVATAAWHRDFAERARALGYGIIWSLSYELFDAYCWGDWKQRAADGSPALTGWVPPSTLLSPAHPGAMGYLRQIAQAFIAIALAAGLAPKFQVGEPWWWVMPDGRPCLYDDAARAAFGSNPPVITDVRGPKSAAAIALLDQAGAMLAASTAALVNAVKAVAPGCQTLVLAYLPSILDENAPEVQRMNLPVGWAKPAFDVLQLEDYDWASRGQVGLSEAGVALACARLGYLVEQQHYLAGFVARPDDRARWAAIDEAAMRAEQRGVARTYIWALPQ
ncbi:TIGR02217 family protein, partial [Sphingomonas sp. 28-62-11]|uniref:non-contractile tail sheath protein n=1 Tax=Sphingomonas sp. 28-62-11 TaxID=1970432 RepID=UPI000BD97C67